MLYAALADRKLLSRIIMHCCSHMSRHFDCEQSLLCSFLWLVLHVQVNEGTKTMNSQLGLAFVARLADVLRDLPADSSRTTAIAKDIAKHLAPFDTSACLSPQNQTLNEKIEERNGARPAGSAAPIIRALQ